MMTYLIIENERIYVLVSRRRYGVTLKLSKPHNRFDYDCAAEAQYLQDYPELIKRLKNGEQIKL